MLTTHPATQRASPATTQAEGANKQSQLNTGDADPLKAALKESDALLPTTKR
jgi:hypothetical protein